MADTDELIRWGRENWGARRMTLAEIVVAHGVVHGDLCRIVRTLHEANDFDGFALRKEFGNLVLSSLRWIDDLGLDPEECIGLAQAAQRAYVRRRDGLRLREPGT